MEEKNSFESKLQRLNEIVKAVENNTLSLDESLPLFEEGTNLIKELEEMLNNAEQKIATIVEKK